MKRINHLALGAAICLISCNSNTKTHNNTSAENATNTSTETVAAANVENTPDESSLIKFDLKIDDEIPAELEGFDIERQTYMGEEGEDETKYVMKKDDEHVAELFPNYDDKTIRMIILFSEKYCIENNLHAGSRVSDVMAAYPDDIAVNYGFDDHTKRIKLDVRTKNIQFYVDSVYYDGQLPEVWGIEGTYIDNPTFKPDAKICKIRFW